MDSYLLCHWGSKVVKIRKSFFRKITPAKFATYNIANVRYCNNPLSSVNENRFERDTGSITTENNSNLWVSILLLAIIRCDFFFVVAELQSMGKVLL